MALLAALAAPASAQEVVVFPPDDEGAATLEARRAAQLRTKDRFEVPIDFTFTDRVLESGIDFEHRSVPDSAKNWKPVHYDHGNGVVVADIDGDDRLDIYFVTQLGSNRLYRNLGGGRFEDITAKAGVGLEDRVSSTASFADVDNDGDPDLFVTTVRYGNALFANDGKGVFRDVTEAAGLAYTGHSSAPVFVDYDLDGLLDIFLCNVGVYTLDEEAPEGFWVGRSDAFEGQNYPERTEPSILYRNLGSLRFEDVTEKVGLVETGWTGDATFTDFDHDLYPDLYVLNMQGDDHYWQNQGGERFVEKTAELFPGTPWGAMGLKFFDRDNDGRMDLYLTDMHSDMHDERVHPLLDEKRKFDLGVAGREGNVHGNAFYDQRPDGTFLEVSDSIGAENYWPWGLSVADLNADGWQDVFITSSMNFPFRYGVNSVMLNNRGRGFLDSEFILGVEPRRDGRTHKPLFDVDCDGADRENKACLTVEGKVTVAGALGTRSSVVFDVDGDGDLDILTNEFNDVPQLLISDLAARRDVRSLDVVLRGTRSNRDGLGALVTVKAGDDAWVRYHDGKSGYLSQSSMPLTFGLGDHEKVDSVEVLWPSGARQTVTEGITLGARLEIVEPAEGGEEQREEPAGPAPN